MKKLLTVGVGIVGMSLVIAGCGNEKDVAKKEGPPPQLVIEDQQSLIYVPNAGEGTVSVIDPNENKVVDTLSLGTKQASHGIALSLDGKTLYTGTGFEGQSLIVIDTETMEVINEIKFNGGVHGIDLSGDGQFLYVSLSPGLGNDGNGALAVLKTDTMEKIAEIDTVVGSSHVAVTPDGSQVWLAHANGGKVSVIDTKTNTVVKIIKVAEVPNEVAVSPDGKWAFVANVGSDLVSVIEIESLQVVKTVQAGDGPHGVTVSPDGTELWVSSRDSFDVTIIDTATLETKTIIPTGGSANHVAFSQNGKWAYVTNQRSNEIVKIDAEKKEVVARIPVGIDPHEISLEDYVSTNFETINYMFTDQGNQAETSNQSISERFKNASVDGVGIDVLRVVSTDSEVYEVAKVDFEKYDAFQISLTTHSGDLSSLPLDQNTFLITNNGEKVKPVEWIVQSNDSHHPSFLVVFPKQEAGQVTLEIGKLGAKPIQLTWE
ncbi:cytochrome D1 domain-containing protein [Schinkia azotoformans]|uniref:cytochrome D1 domain-containing protein n=1 Tax=Schinkia azotoformans TaxID=1454 RepID=UPI002DB8B6BC|nr:cytochrome D1 domain-containing protein [Schinkia azotoformans]MEC1742826.1 cytochrome D1 domain-containing protein [Schinkia azotoformans]MEC1769001.1 cytochrome D1 domain-containing protein [Schinkia azotoformans]MEC1789586.1 cytochrome D1 domain-containing protein [Schinkia azotoformans]MED4378410.1 cytochrome D1 domain-containing protein [Schinkia azotoformans]MED4417446.1 cytochrome D1 domain-containing protein [Schinkia azotoformans]